MARHAAGFSGAIALAAWLAMSVATGTAQAWEIIEEYQPVEGYLGDKQPDTQRYPNREIYDPPTAKFYSVFDLAVEEQDMLAVDVYSFDFQPVITVQDKGLALVGQGTIEPVTYNADGSQLYHARIEFVPPSPGPTQLLISSYVPNQGGRFKMEWSLYGPDRSAAFPGQMATQEMVAGWDSVAEYDPVEGYLGDRQPDTQAFRTWEVYDQPTAKFYAVYELAMEERHALTVDVFSFEFQPIILVQDKQFALLGQGTIQPTSYYDDGSELYHARIEFHTPWAGPAELLISSYAAGGQGNYKMEWALWKEAAPSIGAGGVSATPDSDCDCQDPATGRRYQSPFEDLGECIPERAIKWCN